MRHQRPLQLSSQSALPRPALIPPPPTASSRAVPLPAAPPAAAEVGFDGTLEELQALVASLAMAVTFSKAISACMPTITQLLASSTISDVQESIAMLLTCKQFEVDGAADTIRKMLPLIFSKDQGEAPAVGTSQGGSSVQLRVGPAVSAAGSASQPASRFFPG